MFKLLIHVLSYTNYNKYNKNSSYDTESREKIPGYAIQ